MARRGKLSREEKMKPIDPNLKQQADKWINEINSDFDEVMKACRANSVKRNIPFSDDVFQETIILCYNAITRNGLKDLSNQGCRNYFFRAYNMNIIYEYKKPYNKRRVHNDEILIDDRTEEDNGLMKQIYDDFATTYILERIEGNVEPISFYLFRLKYLMPKMTYRKLVEITKVKDAKKRVRDVMRWVRENVTKEEINRGFRNKMEI